MKKSTKTNRYGIWVDHKKAVVVCIDGEDRLSHETLKSGLDIPRRFAGETTDKTGLFGYTLDRQTKEQRKTEREFHSFIKGVVGSLENVNAILLMGPGNARHHFENEVGRRKTLGGVWLENRAADKMTIPQLRAAVMEHFKVPRR
jgi:hypothetical protein